jgi:hypothetical protein
LEPPTPTYGISVAQEGCLHGKPDNNLLPLGKGLNISTYKINLHVRSWVEINKVRGKSIWGKELPEVAYAISTICMAPQCALIKPAEIGLNASTIIVVPKTEYNDFPWDALINSSVIRFLHLLVLRTALVGVGTPLAEQNRRVSWCTIYPRTISALPVPKNLVEDATELKNRAIKLRQLAERISTRWERAVCCLSAASKKPLSLHNIDFTNWQHDIEEKTEFRLEKDQNKCFLRVYFENQRTFQYIESDYHLLNIVKYIIDNRGENETILTLREFQNLMIPEDPKIVSELIDAARDPNNEDIQDFKRQFAEVDDIISKAYGLSSEQWKYVQERLTSRPFDVLVPRWPWKSVEMREIQEYNSDRFA